MSKSDWRTIRRQYTARVRGTQIAADVRTIGNRGDDVIILTPLGMSIQDVQRAIGYLSLLIESDFPREKRRRKAREKRQIAEQRRQAEKSVTDNTERL